MSDLVVYGVQWQDYGEEWGWETAVHTTDEGEARKAFEEAKAELARIYEPDDERVLYALRHIRLVRITVFEELPLFIVSPHSDPIGVQEIERGA